MHDSKLTIEIKNAISAIVDSNQYILGPEVKLFESNFSTYCGTSHCVAVASGLDALTLICLAYKELGVFNDGDEILVPANTYIATILSIKRSGLVPVLIEPDGDYLQMDPTKVEERISSKTKAICAVHLYGYMTNMAPLWDISKKYHLIILEDAAQAHGGMYHQKRAGNCGDAAAFSFYPTKNLGSVGDAGAVTTNNRDLADTIFSLRNYGRTSRTTFDYFGMNSRMDELQAAILNVKLKYLDKYNKKRVRIAQIYSSRLSNPLVTIPKTYDESAPVWHQYVIQSPKRNQLQQFLSDAGIFTDIHYPIPAHHQKAVKELNQLSLPITERLSKTILSLPISPLIESPYVKKVVSAINSFVP